MFCGKFSVVLCYTLLLLFFRIYVDSVTHLCGMAHERAIRRIMNEISDEKFKKLIAPIVVTRLHRERI